MGRKQELEEDLGEYLKGKRKKKIDVVGMIKGMMPKPTPPPVKLPPEIQVYGDKEERQTEEKKVEEVSKIEEFEETKTEIEEYEAETKPFWQSILNKLGMKPNKVVQKEEELLKEKGEEAKIKEMVEKELMLKDIRDLAKMTLFVIKQLPEERLEQFKQSSDFSDLKELLKKYKLIK